MSSPLVALTLDATEKHTATVIFLHGIGDDKSSWAPRIAPLLKDQKHIKLIFPRARVQPVSLFDGEEMVSWFNIPPDTGDRKDVEDHRGIMKSSLEISKLIEDEIKGTSETPGIPASRIILGGFSQGGTLAFYTGITGPATLAGLICLSGHLPLMDRIKWDLIQKPAILQCQGDADPFVPLHYGVKSTRLLQEYIPNVTFKTFPGMAHIWCEEELQDVKSFITRLLPPI